MEINIQIWIPVNPTNAQTIANMIVLLGITENVNQIILPDNPIKVIFKMILYHLWNKFFSSNLIT